MSPNHAGWKAQDRPDDIETMSHTINSQGLPQIGILLLEIQFLTGRRIQQSPNAPDSIDRKTAEFRGRAAEIGLKQATEKTGGKSEIGKEIFHTDPCGFRNNCFVSLRNGFERPEIQFVVKLMHGTVEWFQGSAISTLSSLKVSLA